MATSGSANMVARQAQSVATYGAQIATVFHNHSLAAERIPAGFEGGINILDSTVTTLKQALELLNEEAAGRKLFNDEGLKYVQLLTLECATMLAKVEPLLANACLPPREVREKRKAERKAVAEKGEKKTDPLELKLDEKAFLETVETAKWSRVNIEMEALMDRLYDLQLHLLLVFQVVKVGALSKDLSSGTVDVKSIVAYHDRITRTADLIGIKPPTGRSTNRRVNSSSSESESSSDSDSSIGDLRTAKRKIKSMKRRLRRPFPPPPPPPPPLAHRAPPPPFNGHPVSMHPAAPPAALPSIPTKVIDAVNPPSYAESRSPSSPTPSDTKTKPEVAFAAKEEEIKEPVEEKKPLTLEPRLFKSNTHGLAFKIKSLFRSKQSLAEEMKKALSDSESQLLAYVLRGHDLKQVPHSAFHSLEATHMKTILSQLNDDSWYKTFTSLSVAENQSLERVIRPPGLSGTVRDVVVLKVIERNRLNSWVVLLRDIFQKYPLTYVMGPNRVLLVIVREKLVDGKAPDAISNAGPKRGPPPPHPGKRPIIRPPPGLPTPTRATSRISDLRFPPPPSAPPGWHINWSTPRGPPAPLNPSLPTLKESEALEALTVYTEYTLRQVESTNDHNPPGPTKSWSRITITQESNEMPDILSRIQKFELSGGNIIELKLRMSEQQAKQVDRLMDELKQSERDTRFDWSWVEMTMYTHSGEVSARDLMKTDQDVPFNFALTATHIHVIAKRTLKPSQFPQEVYMSFFRPPPPPGMPHALPGPPMPPGPPGPPGLPGPPPGWRGGPPIVHRPGPRIVNAGPPRRRNRRGSFTSSGSDSDTVWASDSSEGEVRRRLRRYKARKVKRTVEAARRRNRSPFGSDDSGSGSDSDSEDEEDVIEVKVVLKRGGDVVKALLELWTPEAEGKGKGKEVV